MKPGDRRRFFDAVSEWRTTGDIGDNDIYFLPATVVKVHTPRTLEEADIVWDHEPEYISKGHFTYHTKPTHDNMVWTLFFFLMQMCDYHYETSPTYYWDRQHETFA